MKIDDFPCGESVELTSLGSWPNSAHWCERRHFSAIVAAWHANRPLLVRGEAGIGKSQLANAAAQILKWQFISIGIQPQTSYADLLWEFDAVGRLATAQLLGSLRQQDTTEAKDSLKLPVELELQRFIRPGPLWWAYRPKSAAKQCDLSAQDTCPFLVSDATNKASHKGVVLLVDEIDKADSRLPNGLLEVLGNGDFRLPAGVDDDSLPVKPLVVITSNDERQLPVALLRRCLVLDMALPKDDKLVEHLLDIAESHASKKVANIGRVPKKVRIKAAEEVLRLREQNVDGYKPPGVAEYLDMLRALGGLGGKASEKLALLEEIKPLVLVKRTQLES